MTSNLDRVLGEFKRTGLVWMVSAAGEVRGVPYDELSHQERERGEFFLTRTIAEIKSALVRGRS